MHWVAPEDLLWTADDIATVTEPIYSALNLLRLLILREGPRTPGFAATLIVVGRWLSLPVGGLVDCLARPDKNEHTN